MIRGPALRLALRRLVWVLPLVAAASPAVAAPLPPQMHTVAGGGSCAGAMTSGGPCDNVVATSVPIGRARAVSPLPGGGFLYVDSANNLVREVSAAGVVTTVAGDGTTTDADGGPAVDSGLDGPVSVAALPGGGFLITEYNASVIRMVSPGPPGTATITTIAGTGAAGPDNGATGSATSLPLDYPTEAEPTAGGGVLIANFGNNDVRMISPGGTISTIAGAGACDDASAACDGAPANAVALHDPVSVSPIEGGAGGYLIAEDNYAKANDVRRVSSLSPLGTFMTVAGSPGQPGGYGGDGGPARSALLNSPSQVVSTGGGGYVIVDSGNEVIRSVSSGGTITAVAGSPGVGGYAGDGGAATAASVDGPTAAAQAPDGNLLIADDDNGAIREVTNPSVSTISLTPGSPNGSNGWYVSPVLAVVSASQGAQISCELDPLSAPPAFGAIPAGCSYGGAGGEITGDGSHTLYAASVNSFGDQELPVSASLKIDATPPTLTCGAAPSFTVGRRHAAVSAAVADTVSGPASAVASTSAVTSMIGSFQAIITGADQAGNTAQAHCSYRVLPATLSPVPRLRSAFSVAGGRTKVGQLVIVQVPATASVNVSCKGVGCPLGVARNVTGKVCRGRPCTATKQALRNRRRAVDLTPLFAHARLAAGAELTVSVTEKNTVGHVWKFRTRTLTVPSKQSNCLAPPAWVPGQRCSRG